MEFESRAHMVWLRKDVWCMHREERSVCAAVCGVDVHKDSGANPRSNAFLSWLVWTDIPGVQLAARVGPRCACHVILMPFSFHGWDLGCSVKCLWVCVCVCPVNCTARSNLRLARNTSMWWSKPEESRGSCVETNGMNYYSLANEEMYSRRRREKPRAMQDARHSYGCEPEYVIKTNPSAWQEGQTDQLCRRIEKER